MAVATGSSTAPNEQLRRAWEAPTRILGILGTVDHKVIGIRYIVTAFVFFLLAGISALLIRLQLAVPNNTLLSPEAYNQLFTMHGVSMIFLFSTPILFGFGNYLVPLMIGARDQAFPRLNALSYWVFLFSGLFMYSSLLFGAAPDGGWFAYVPLTSVKYSPGLNLDFWALGLLFLSISSTAGAINFIVTIFKMRAPGMSVNRMPLFIWGILISAFSVLFAIPALSAANILLELERKFGVPFFDPARGGNPLLWQHLFWFFGHPDVYIILLPAIGMISEILPAFTRRRVVGYTLLVLSTISIGIIAFGVWVHHMFATGLSPTANSFFSAASIVIGIPSGLQIFAWLATMITGRPILKTAFLFVVGFVITFVLGGLTGVMFPATAFDRQVTDSYFVVAHFHYTLVGGAVFPLFAGFYYWLPKITGRLLSERLGKWHFWLFFIGFHLTFFPQHLLGLMAMPRRVYTYEAATGWQTINLISTLGAFVLTAGVLAFIINVYQSLQSGSLAGENPWGAGGLEWATDSPPPSYNFQRLPLVRRREPLWPAVGGAPTSTYAVETLTPDPTNILERESLVTTLLDASPDARMRIPNDTMLPLFLAFSLLILFIGLLITQWAVVAIGAILVFISIVVWVWPAKENVHDNE